MFDGKFLTILAFAVINFAILFIVKTRTSLVISVIIAHLVAIVFFAISISNYESFREITLAFVIYSMVILFLISNYGSILVETNKEKTSKRDFLFNKIIYLIALVAFFLIFSVTKDASEMRDQALISKDPPMKAQSYDEVKKAIMRNKLRDNFLLKRSSDVILIIVAASTIMLLLSKKEK